MTESLCDQMDSHNGETQISMGSDKSCCATSQAPAPELQYKAAEISLAATTVAVTFNMLAVPPVRLSSTLLAHAEEPSPPSLQSLFCTFLI